MIFLLSLFLSYDDARTYAVDNNKQLVVVVNQAIPTNLLNYTEKYNFIVYYTDKPFKINSELTVNQGVLVARYHSYNHDLALRAVFLDDTKDLLNQLDEYIY